MIKHLFGAILILSSLLSKSQTYRYKDGDIVGRQTVVSMPVRAAGFALAQGLVYYPKDYFTSKKKYPVMFFLHGAGQAANPPKYDSLQNINFMNQDGLNQWLANGGDPYGIDPITKDTIRWIIVSPHCVENDRCSYDYPKLMYTIPYMLSKLRIDSSCIWVGGLSGGGSGTWSMAMGDTVICRLVAGIMPEATGGWEDFIKIATYKANLIANLKAGLATLAITGEFDPTYNAAGFFQYRTIDTIYQKAKYYDSIVKGQAHTSAVWQQPWPLTARVWSKTMNSWTQMWGLRKKVAAPPVVTPPVIVPPITTPPYPVRIIIKYSDSSCSIIWQK